MGFVGTSLWKVRQTAGDQALLWPGVTILVFNQDDLIWIGKRTDNEKWSICGGLMELGDSALTAAEREVEEELGLKLENIEWLGVLTDPKATSVRYPNGHELQAPSYLFKGRVQGEIKLDDEHTEHRWVSLDELRDMKIVGYTSHILKAYDHVMATGQPYFG